MFDERAGKNMDERGRISWVEGLIILCGERGIGNFVREREGGGGVSQPSSHHPASKWPRIL